MIKLTKLIPSNENIVVPKYKGNVDQVGKATLEDKGGKSKTQ